MAVLPLCLSLVWQGLTAAQGVFLFLFVRALAGGFGAIDRQPNTLQIVHKLSTVVFHLKL